MKIINAFGKKKSSPKLPKDPTTPLTNKISELSRILCRLYPSHSKTQKAEHRTSFIFDTLAPCFQMYATCYINPLTRQLSVTVSILKNGVPLHVNSRALTILLCRQFNKFNSYVKYGSFRVNPLTRELSLKLSTLFTGRQFEEYLLDTTAGVAYITDELKSAANCIRYNFYLVLIQIGELEPDFTKVLYDQKEDFRDRPEVQRQFEKLNKLVIQSNIRYEWMDSDQLKRNNNRTNCSVKDQIALDFRKQMNGIQDAIKRPSTSLIYWLRCHGQKSIYFVRPQPAPSSQKTNSLITSLIIRQPKMISTHTTDNHFIFQKIKINNPEQAELPMQTISWDMYDFQPFFQSDLSGHRRVRLHYNLQNGSVRDLEYFQVKMTQNIIKNFVPRINQQKPFQNITKQMCFKKESSSTGTNSIKISQQIKHQKKILANIMYSSSQYVCRHYFTYQQGYNDRLLMEYTPFLSIDRFQARHTFSISILSKLFLMLEACHSLRFLHQNNIYHLSVQPKNMLIFKNLVLKLNDFSNSYHPNVLCDPKGTPPYSAPQIYDETMNLSEKQDMFSLGMTLSEILFGDVPIRIVDDEKLQATFRDLSYFTRCLVVTQKLGAYGPLELMRTIVFLILKCMDPVPENRPCFEWVTIFLQEAINYVNRLY